MDSHNVFSSCGEVIPLRGFFDACVHDVCMSISGSDSRMSQAALCNVVSAVGQECGKNQAAVVSDDYECRKYSIKLGKCNF